MTSAKWLRWGSDAVRHARKSGLTDQQILASIRAALGEPKSNGSASRRLACLSPQTRRVYDYWITAYRATGAPPTFREAISALSISSTSVLNYHLAQLEAAGLLTKLPGRARGYRLPPSAWD